MTTVSGRTPANTHSSDTRISEAPLHQHVAGSYLAQYKGGNKKADPLAKVEALQIKLLRLVYRLGLSPENIVVVQVLYRLQLASLIRGGESYIKRSTLKIDRAKAIAAQQEAVGQTDLDISFKVLVLGKTGVGKSATINSLFGQTKIDTDAFQPSTKHIREVVGTIKGINVTLIDTPGLLPSFSNKRRNRKTMLAVKRYIKKSSPDIVLYFDRLDVFNTGSNDCPLMKLITEVFGSSIWFNTIIVMTHSSSPPPEGPDGYPVSYEAFVRHRTSRLQHQIQQAVSTTQIESPFLLVENHPMCRTNKKGEMVLPNGQVWMSQFLLLCTATKILGDANHILKFQDTIQLTQSSSRMLSIPHLLSTFLRSRTRENEEGFDNELEELSDHSDDEYDQLPPIRILSKSQFQKLSKTQRNAYLDELDYRETLYLKKHWREDLKRRKENKMQNNVTLESNDGYESNASPDAHVSEIPLPLNFNSDSPSHRYRCLMSDEPWVLRPVLDSQGWDHDIGFDGVNLEGSQDIKKDLHASITGQIRKDKEDFSIQSECGLKYIDPRGHFLLGGMGVQTAGKDVICTINADAMFRNWYCNSTGGGLSVTSLGNIYFLGAKLEDSILVGRRFMLTLNAGRLAGCGQAADGGSLEATLRGRNYPVRDENTTLAGTILSFDKEVVLGGSLRSDFRVGRGAKLSVNANLNSRKVGKICLRTNTSEHVHIALVGVVSLIQALLRKMNTNTAE